MEELTATAVKQRCSAATWKERVAACRSSGQNVADWCSANGINRKSYYRWERKLLQESGNKLSDASRPRQLQRFTEITPMNSTSNTVAVLRVGEITCELRQGITPEQLNAIVQGLASHA